jgi:hypothetical protein
MQIKPYQTEQAIAGNKPQGVRTREPGDAAASFRGALSEASAGVADKAVTVKQGDTLIGLTRGYLGQSSNQFSASQLYNMAKNVARDSGIRNPDLIVPGQTVNMSSLSTLAALKLRQPVVENVQMTTAAPTASTPVLDKTLARAVSKGYLASGDEGAVRDKIMTLSARHNFSPEDFAHMTLMESDGMNPRASNGNCHGIIQFCDGANRGAASAGMGSNPKAILSQSVLQQLDLVDRYFDETRLKDHAASLDNLYLTVLTPSARNETRPDAPLNISGRQASHLYEGRDQNGVMTRNSIIAGLKQNARERLADFSASLARAEASDK